MALVPIDEYEGSIIGNTVLEGLTQLGIVDIINRHGYIVNITGVHGVTPPGMIDDTPSEHKISIDKRLRLANKKELSFVKGNKIDVNSKEYLDSLKELRSCDIKTPQTMGIKQNKISEIYLDKNDCCYKHIIEINVKQGEQEETYNYLDRLFKLAADLLVSSKI